MCSSCPIFSLCLGVWAHLKAPCVHQLHQWCLSGHLECVGTLKASRSLVAKKPVWLCLTQGPPILLIHRTSFLSVSVSDTVSVSVCVCVCVCVCLSVCLSLFCHLTVYQRILTIAVLFPSFLEECVGEDPVDKGWGLGANLGAHECTQGNSMIRVQPGWFSTSPGPWLPNGWARAQQSGTFFCTCVNTVYHETWKEHMPGLSFRVCWK